MKLNSRKDDDEMFGDFQPNPQQEHPTTLATRTTECVITDLKQIDNQTPFSDLGGLSLNHRVLCSSPDVPNEEAGDSDVDLESHQHVPKSRKFTERNRSLKVIADNFIQDMNEKLIRDGNKVQPEYDVQPSAKWLIDRCGDRQIISTPREYQLELFEKAKEKNLIAVLDTGSGKTLIAVLLLRYILAQELQDRALGKQHRTSFFLADSIQLVLQQHAVLKANLDQPIKMFYGDIGRDLWSKEAWEKHCSENMVIVCTAEILRQCLHRSFVSMNQINLLIFDEAHHTKKDHPYARIIKDFYIPYTDQSCLPKIFGMTASPVDARVDVRKAAAELEAIMHCEITTAADLSLLQYTIKSQQEQLAHYAPLGPAFETPLFKQMNERFKTNPVLSKALNFAREATRELGAWCSDQVWLFCLAEYEIKKLQAKTERQYHMKKIQGPLAVLEKHKMQLQEGQDIVKAWAFNVPHYNPKEGPSNLSSKALLLVRILKEQFKSPTNDKCIVFVRQRYTARLLARLFSHQHMSTPYLHVGTLVGTRTGEAGDLDVSFRQQVIAMMSFRKGTVNCLFATSIAEEGLDIPDCNLVIRFDLYSTLIQYIQSRGRARHANSRYIHMAEQGNQGHNNIIMEVRKNEHKLKAFCAALPEDRKLTGSVFDMDHFLATERAHRVWKHPDTGAKLNYKMSLMVLANFVDSLPQSQDSNFQPEYCFTIQNKQFVCEVLLPERSPIRGAVGRPATTKQVAKCSAAFETCLDLIKGKYLNEWLLSTFTKQLPAMRNATLAVDSKKREAYSMRTKPALWGMRDFPRKLFVSTLILATADSLNRPSQPLALLTRDQLPQLPSFFLHFGAGRRSQAVCTSLNNAIVLTPELVNRINKFTLCLFDDVFSKLYESNPSKMPYFLVPIISHAQVDPDTNASDLIAWDVLKSVEEKLGLPENSGVSDAWCTKPDDFFQGKFIIDPYDGSRKMWSLGVTQKYKPLDPVPPNTAPRTGQRKNSHNIMEYSCSLWTKARAMRVFDPDQRVIEAEYISLRRNLLDEFDCSADESPKQCFLIMEPLKISPLPITVVAMAYLLPAIIHRVESYLIALEAAELLHLNIHPDLALEAVTKNSENTDRRNQEQVNFQRGMGNNYERLEFLGDCFLKMATSISLYGLHPDNDEYRYHVDRMLLVCNKNLKDNAIRLKLYEYIRSQSFNRRAWYPDGLVLVKGKTTTAPVFHKLSDKSIADVCEAFIGAALLTFHKDKDMDNAVRAVTELVSSENHTVLRYTDYYKLYQKPKYQLAVSTESQLDLTRKLENKHPYHFHHPRLARSAFTHPSYPFSYEHVPSYQRLEFLGDALLDMACVNFLFHNFISKDPQWLTEHKMAMVSNQFLGALCVSLGFHTHLLVFSAHIQKQITVYVEDITEAQRQAEDDAVRSGKLRGDYARDFWIHVRQPPKCLPDIIEAYIGAIFVDSEYNYYEVERFFDMHIKWFFEDMSIYDTFANKHPANFLARFLQINMGCMDWSIIAREVPSVNGNNPTVVALVVIHGEIVADFQAESSRCAKIGGAKIAIELLSGLPLNDFKKKYDCRCILENDEEESEGGIYAHKFHGTAV